MKTGSKKEMPWSWDSLFKADSSVKLWTQIILGGEIYGIRDGKLFLLPTPVLKRTMEDIPNKKS